MFRIKTDIRHYRCDSRAKVERLIRNWVIRPADLIHDPDQERWEPIGEHPSFSPLFDELAERHDNEPNTVVTPEVADKAAQDRALSDDGPDRPGAPAAAVLRRPKSAKKAPPKQPAPPTPSSDVVGVIRDSDEITMMTEKTLDLLTESADTTADEAAQQKPAAARVEVDAAIETDADDQDAAPATVNSAPDSRLDADDVADEPTQLIERPEFDDESEASEDDASEGDDQAPEIAAEQDSVQKAQDDQEEPPDKQEDRQRDNGAHDEAKQRRKPRRHDLPEEVFVTAELTGNSLAESDDEPLDELGALGSDVDDVDKSDDESTDEIDTSPMSSRRESRSSWNIILDEIPPPADDESAACDDPVDEDSADALRDTAEDDVVDDDPVDDDSADALRDTADLEPVDRDALDPLEDTAELSTDDVDQAREAAADDGEPAPEGLPDDFEIDDDALEEAFDDFEEQAIAARNTAQAPDDQAAQAEQDDQDATADLEEISILEALPDHDANLGYEVSFPIAITPSQKALSLGIEKTGRAKKSIDRRYPLPRQKTPGQVRTAEYDLSPKSSRFSLPLSPPLMAIAVVVVLILILSVALAVN